MTPAHVGPREVEVLRELVESGCGQAVAALGRLLRRPASAGATEARLRQGGGRAREIVAQLGQGVAGGARGSCELVSVGLRLEGPLTGRLVLAWDAPDAERLATALGYPVAPGAAWGQLAESAVLESGNIVGSAFVSAIAHRLGGRLLTGVPDLARGRAAACLEQLLGTDAPELALATGVAVGGPEVLKGLILVVPAPASLPTLLGALDSA